MQMLAQHSTAKAIVRREGGAVHLLERSSSGHASLQVRQMQCSAVLMGVGSAFASSQDQHQQSASAQHADWRRGKL